MPLVNQIITSLIQQNVCIPDLTTKHIRVTFLSIFKTWKSLNHRFSPWFSQGFHMLGTDWWLNFIYQIRTASDNCRTKLAYRAPRIIWHRIIWQSLYMTVFWSQKEPFCTRPVNMTLGLYDTFANLQGCYITRGALYPFLSHLPT